MSDLPRGWRSVKLETIADLINGDRGTNYPSKEALVESGVPFINAGHLTETGSIDLTNMNYITETRFKVLGGGKIRHNDVLYCLRGSLGKAAVVRELTQGAIASSLVIIRPRELTSGDFIYNFLVSPTGRALIDLYDNGSAQPNLAARSVAQYDVPLPPLAEQRRIVAKIDALTARSRRAKEALDAIPALLERFRQSVLAAAFRGDLTAAWREKNPDVEPAEALLKRIRAERRRRWEEAEFAKLRAKGKVPGDDRWKEKYEEPAPVDPSELSELPEGWAWSSLQEIALNFDGDRVPLKVEDRDKRAGRYPYYGASGVIDTIDAYLFDGAFLLLAEDGANLLSRSSPIAFEAKGQFWVNNHAHVLQPVTLPTPYLREYLNGIDLAQYVTGTAQPKLTQKNMNAIPIPVAPSAEAEVIGTLVDKSTERIVRLVEHREALSSSILALDRAVLQKAFRGELVPQDPADEPAEALLERLRAETAPKAAAAPARKTARKRP